MDFLICSSACTPCDPATDTVRFDASTMIAEVRGGAPLDRVEETWLQEQRRKQGEEALAWRQAAEERAAEQGRLQRTLEGEAQRREARASQEKEARRRREEEEARLEEVARIERERSTFRLESERLAWERRQQEDRELAEDAARREEASRAERDRQRRAAVASFLKEHGFAGGVRGPKRNLVNTTFPLHRAAKLGDVQMAEWLLVEGADALQTNSAGRTPAQVAGRHNKGSSHAEVLKLLGTRGVARAGGA